MIRDAIKRAQEWIEGLTEEAAAYLLSGFLFLLFSFFNLVIDGESETVLFILPILLLLYGFYIYIVEVYRPVWGSFVGKILISGLIFMGSSFSLALSKMAVNTSLQVPSSPFLSTISITAVLVSPLAITLIFGFLGVAILPIAVPFFLNDDNGYSVKRIIIFWNWKSVGGQQLWKLFIRLGILIFLISVAWTFNGNNSWYTDKVDEFTRWYAYTFDTEGFSHCEMDSGQRIAYIDSGNVIVASKNEEGYKFQVTKCVISQ